MCDTEIFGTRYLGIGAALKEGSIGNTTGRETADGFDEQQTRKPPHMGAHQDKLQPTAKQLMPEGPGRLHGGP